MTTAATKTRQASARSAAASATSPYSGAAIASAALGGIALGVAAMIGRKFVVQAPTALAGDWDQALAAEHKATLALFDALQATGDHETAKRSTLLTQLKHALGKHALEEENAVYPALRDAGEVGGADELNAEHGYVKQYLYTLGNMPKDSPAFLAELGKFRADIQDHMREEEEELFPRLKSRLTAEQNKALTLAMNKEGFKLA